MNFDLGDLRAFVAVADLGSFKAAAEALHLSQPALSRRVEKLEQALGFRLFERTTRRVELNAMGRHFLPKARHVLHELEGTLLGMADLADRLRGQVTVACVPSAVPHFLAHAVALFQRRFPRIRVRLLDESAPEILLTVTRSEADFGVTYMGATEPDLAFGPLLNEPFVLVCPRSHPLAGRPAVRWAELAEQVCISLAPGTGNRLLIDQALSAQTLNPRWACEVQHVPALLSLVEAGVGVGAAPLLAVPKGRRSGVVAVPLVEPAVHRTIGVIRRHGKDLGPAAQAFHDLLAESAAAIKPVLPRSKPPRGGAGGRP